MYKIAQDLDQPIVLHGSEATQSDNDASCGPGPEQGAKCGNRVHGGLLQNSTARKYMDEGEFQEPSSYALPGVKALDMLRFEKWDWRRAK